MYDIKGFILILQIVRKIKGLINLGQPYTPKAFHKLKN